MTGVERSEALAVILERAAELDVPVHRAEPAAVMGLNLRLKGRFQQGNAGVAWKVGELLGLPTATIRVGLEAAWLPGRFQVEPFGLGVASKSALILDVAHNTDGAEVLREALQARFPNQRLAFVVGMTQGHQPLDFLRVLGPCIAKVYAVTPSLRPLPATEVYGAALELGLEAHLGLEVAQALDVLETSGLSVVVTGSFYAVGQVPQRYWLKPQPRP